jgi:ABC-type transport system involved in multi-copper enzyme maturation permease subunit
MIAPTTPPPTFIAEPAAPTSDGNWLTEFARLVGWELFLAWRRRAMMITLTCLLLVGYLLIVLVQYGVYFSDTSNSRSALYQAQALTFPGALSVGAGVISYLGVLLFVVLAGALIGSEYSYSTLRLSLARGVGRGRLLAAQIVALAILALLLAALALILSALVGLLGLAFGLPQAAGALSAELLGEIVIYWLALAFNVFAYALISVWIGTLSRSVAGAIAGPLVFIVVEVVTTDILTGIGIGAASLDSPLINFIARIPDYVMGVNTSALITWAGDGPYPFTSGGASVGVAHALIVSLVYCALFIVISYLALRNRDILE